MLRTSDVGIPFGTPKPIKHEVNTRANTSEPSVAKPPVNAEEPATQLSPKFLVLTPEEIVSITGW